MERDWLAGLLWPERDDRQALRNSLAELRRALGSEAGRLRTVTSRTVSLDLAGASVDVLAFDAALERGDLASLAEAVSLYRGPLLEGCAEEWAFQERQVREQAYLAALEKLAAESLAHGDAAAAESWLRRAAAVDPLRESVQRGLMQALAAGGNYASALLTYRELRQRLHRELNAEPDPETKALFQRLRAEARGKADVRRQTPDARRQTPEVKSTRCAGTRSPGASEVKGEAAQTPLTLPEPASGVSRLTPRTGEYRLVTVLFADMSRSVEAMEKLDPEEAAALVNRLLQVMVDAVFQFGGQVDRFLGDGLLAIFGMPQAHEDDAEWAIRAALEIREAAARLGHAITAGINTGTVYAGAVGTERHRETTVVGPVVNLASRLREQASPGQILIGEATHRLTRRAFEFSSRSVAAPGIAEAVTAYAVTQALPRPEKPRGIEGRWAPLIGREEELSKLRALLERLLQPDFPETKAGAAVRGQLVSLIAEAGVGKSRLIGELRQEDGVRCSVLGVRTGEPQDRTPNTEHRISAPLWLEGRCLELTATDRYSLFVDLLRQYFGWPAAADDAARGNRIADALRELAARGAISERRAEEIGPRLAELFSLRWGAGDELLLKNSDPEERRHQTSLAVRDFLLALARLQPVLLVLEDLHWADSLSLDLISLLMETLALGRLFLLCSYRPDPEHRCSRLGTIAAQKCPECYTELRLRELTPLQSQQLVAALLGTPELPVPVKERVLDRSRGNPFLMEELVHSLLDRGILYQRDDTWHVRDEPAQQQVPESVQGLILSRVDRLDPELKRLLQHAAVIGRVFPRRLLESSVVSGQWPVASGRWLVASADEGNPDGRSPLATDHRPLTTSHRPLTTALWSLEERGLIYQERAVPEEEYSFRHVLVQETIYESILRSERAGMHRQVAEALESLYGGRLEPYYEPLAFHYERSGSDEETQARALDYLIRAAERAHRSAAHREEAARLAQAIAIAERLGREDQAAELHAQRGMALSRNGRWFEARAELETALATLPQDRTETRAEILIDLANVSYWGVVAPRVRPSAREAMALAEAIHRTDLEGTAMAWLSVADQMDGELRASVSRFERAMKQAGGLRIAPVLACAPLAHYLLGDYGEALQMARQAVASIRGLNNTSATMFALSHLGLALAATGAYTEAMAVFAEARQFGIEYEVGHFVARAAAMSAGMLLDVHDFDGHEERAEEAREMARQAGFAPTVVSAGIDLLLNHARRGEIGRTDALLAEVAEQAAQVGGWHGWLWQLRLTQARAEIALARGDAEEARRWAEESIAQSGRRERVKYQVAGRITRGQALAVRGRCRDAVLELQKAVELARPVDDPALFLRAASALLAVDGDGDLASEARAAAQRIAAALPNEEMRRRFSASAPVPLLS